MNSHEIIVRYRLPRGTGKDILCSDKTPELLCRNWVEKMRRKYPEMGWSYIKGSQKGEARTMGENCNGEFWAIFEYGDK